MAIGVVIELSIGEAEEAREVGDGVGGGGGVFRLPSVIGAGAGTGRPRVGAADEVDRIEIERLGVLDVDACDGLVMTGTASAVSDVVGA